MRIPKSVRQAIQSELFHPPIRIPLWEKLPREVRQQIVALLARLLTEHGRRNLACDRIEEMGDE
jgi:hypothetical protein